ncbi:MAG TPA: 50S ribosomal protein L10 [Acidimicrobiales bacterium]|jgi:large subunit ribosomal protein L10|nr:50S ribosomal protein L10 [Acidimicrobiales bacterium]
MDNPRADKVAVVDEVRQKLDDADAALLTEYRGLSVAALAELRRSLSNAGGEYKIYKNTLVRLAAQAHGLELDELLTGPTAIAFVGARPDGSPGDAVTVAKALRDFARANPALLVKGGLLGDKVLSEADAKALADVAPREELLARLAGGLAAPMVQFAGLLQALPRNFAYGLRALVDQGGAPGAPAPEPAAEAPDEPAATDEAEPAAPAADEADAAPAAQADDAAAAAVDETPAAEAADDTSAAEAADTNAATSAADTEAQES